MDNSYLDGKQRAEAMFEVGDAFFSQWFITGNLASNPKQAFEDGKRLVYMGAIFAFMLTLSLMTYMGSIFDGMIWVLIFIAAYLLVALYIGGAVKYDMGGRPESARRILQDIPLTTEEREEIEKLYTHRWVQVAPWTLKDIPNRDAVIAAIQDDRKHNRVVSFYPFDEVVHIIQQNTGYVGMFLVMSVFALMFVVADIHESGYLWLVVVVMFEEACKGSGYFMTPTIPAHIRIGGGIYNPVIRKGIIDGMGFACFETIGRMMMDEWDPVTTLWKRIPAMLIHTICTIIMFIGIYGVEVERNGSRERDGYIVALALMAGAVVLHVLFNIVAEAIT